MTKPTKAPMNRPTPKPSGVWIATEAVGAEEKLIGVFTSFDLADTACRAPGTFTITNVEMDSSYRGRITSARLIRKLTAAKV